MTSINESVPWIHLLNDLLVLSYFVNVFVKINVLAIQPFLNILTKFFKEDRHSRSQVCMEKVEYCIRSPISSIKLSGFMNMDLNHFIGLGCHLKVTWGTFTACFYKVLTRGIKCKKRRSETWVKTISVWCGFWWLLILGAGLGGSLENPNEV